MNSLMRCIRKNKRGIVGIEAAIVLIAFVVIAAALAYVVINMGFYASQTAKSTINQGIQEATSALELDGYITGYTSDSSNVTYLAIPVKLAVGQNTVDLNNKTTIVAVQCGNFSLANIYTGAYEVTNVSLADLFANVTVAVAGTSGEPNATSFIYNNPTTTSGTVLGQNAKAYIVIALGNADALLSYDKLTVDVRTSVGAALSVVRTIPGGLPANSMVNLG